MYMIVSAQSEPDAVVDDKSLTVWSEQPQNTRPSTRTAIDATAMPKCEAIVRIRSVNGS